MSSSVHNLIIVSVLFGFFAISVFSLEKSVFDSKNFERICDEEKYQGYTMSEICQTISNKVPVSGILFSNKDWINGYCDSLRIELKDDDDDITYEYNDIVLCNYGPDNRACASASDDKNPKAIKYYEHRNVDGGTACIIQEK